MHDDLVKRAATRHHFTEDFALKLFLQVSSTCSLCTAHFLLPIRLFLVIIKSRFQICEGVKHMHDSDPEPLAHRDLKPHNVLLTKDMRPVIMDLGSAAPARVNVRTHAEAQHLQDTAAERCSMPYRPPELFQVNSKCEVDERTDVWSLGCLLHALCFFKSPYDEVFERGDSVALAVQSPGLRFPSDSPYSTDVHNLILWMLTPELAVRPHLQQIMDRLKDMVEAATSGGVAAASNGTVHSAAAST